jgi:hypothetical protein
MTAVTVLPIALFSAESAQLALGNFYVPGADTCITERCIPNADVQ